MIIRSVSPRDGFLGVPQGPDGRANVLDPILPFLKDFNAGRIDTGKLRQSLVSRRIYGGRPGVWYEVGSELFYAILQHKGVEGPIYPRRAKVLRFQPKGSSTFVFRPRTSGFEGVPYLTDALRQLRLSDFEP